MQGKGGEEQDGNAADDEDVTLLVVRPGVVLELQGQHWHFANQQQTEKQHEKEEENGVELLRYEEGMLAQYETAPEEGVGWRWQADELLMLALVKVELGKAQGREGCHQEGRVGQNVFQGKSGK